MATTSRKSTAKKTSKGSASSNKKSAGAHTQKKTTSSKSRSTRPVAKNRKTRTNSAPVSGRVIAGLIIGFIGLLSILAYFKIDAILIDWIRRGIGGLVGWGFYIFPPVAFVIAYVLLHYRTAPIGKRIACAILLPILFGAITHLLFSQADLSSAGGFGSVVSVLFADGKQLVLGGVLSGLLAYGLEKIISIYGAFPILLIALVLCVLGAFDLKVAKIAEWINSKQRSVDRDELQEESHEQKVRTEKRTDKVRKSFPYFDDEFEDDDDEDFPEYAAPKIFTIKNPDKGIDIPLDDEEFDLLGSDDDFLSFGAKTTGTAGKQKDSGAVGRKQSPKQSGTGTENVAPVSIDQAAEMAGVSIDSGIPAAQAEDFKPKITKAEVAAETAAVAAQIEQQENVEHEYVFPPITLLKQSPVMNNDGREEIAVNKERLESTLRSFGVAATISDVTRGPTVTRYDFELEQGVKLSKITNLAGDIALSLGVSNVRIAPITNRISTVGIEVPNKLVSPVYLRDIIDSPKFANSKSILSFALGKNISGEGVVGNIAKLPHLLIAGTTGSGKSVCMNSLIISLLYKCKPDEMKLIMIDPKMVELGVYNGIPHLYVPVVTDPKKAAGALQWAVVEMLKRYRLFSEMGVRDIDTYNEHKQHDQEPILPKVVIVIDELADLMMAASKEVEESICRVAQMGRAAGMHLVIATQRPSADVITGLMKANIPSRIAFAVSSALESRIIMDQQGAEKLVGNGDMLFAPIGTGKPVRIQGAFVSDEEREDIINFIKSEGTAEYSDEIMESIEKSAEDKNAKSSESGGKQESAGSDYDELLPQAVDVIFDTKQASVSMLQRRLKLGYARAARIVDQMEELGIVGPFEGSKPRQVLITKEQWQEMQMIHGTAPTEIMETRMEFGEDSPEE